MVPNISYFHPYLGKWSNLTKKFQMSWSHQMQDWFLFHHDARFSTWKIYPDDLYQQMSHHWGDWSTVFSGIFRTWRKFLLLDGSELGGQPVDMENRNIPLFYRIFIHSRLVNAGFLNHQRCMNSMILQFPPPNEIDGNGKKVTKHLGVCGYETSFFGMEKPSGEKCNLHRKIPY